MKIGMVTACYKPVVNGVTRMVALYKELSDHLLRKAESCLSNRISAR